MIAFVSFTAFVYVCGYVMGAVIGLPRIEHRPARPRYVFPSASIVSTTDWQRLDIATAIRRKR